MGAKNKTGTFYYYYLFLFLSISFSLFLAEFSKAPRMSRSSKNFRWENIELVTRAFIKMPSLLKHYCFLFTFIITLIYLFFLNTTYRSYYK